MNEAMRAWNEIKGIYRVSTLAMAVGLTRQAVYLWKFVPMKYLDDVSRYTGIPRERLRPDIGDRKYSDEGVMS